MRKIFEFLLTLLGFIKKPKPTPTPTPKPSPVPKPSRTPRPSVSVTPKPSSTPKPLPSPTSIARECEGVPVLNKVELVFGSTFEYHFTPGPDCVGVYLQYSRDPEQLNWVTDQNMVSCDSPQTLDIEITEGTVYFAIAEDCEFNLSPSNTVSYTFTK